MFPNAPNKKAPPAPIKRRSRCGKRNWLPFYRPCSFAPRAFARFAGCIRDIAQRILNFFFFFSQYHERKFGESTKKKERGGQKTSNAANPPGLDNPLKIHYTTNRKGAELQDGQLLPEIKKIDRMVWKTWRSIFFVIIVVSLRKFFRDLNGQAYHVHDQPQQAENDHEKREKLRQIHATSLPSPQGSGKFLSKKFRSRGLLRSIVDGNQSPGRTHDHLHCRQRLIPPLRAAMLV